MILVNSADVETEASNNLLSHFKQSLLIMGDKLFNQFQHNFLLYFWL